MRSRPTVLTLWLLAGAALAAPRLGYAGEKKEVAKEFRVEGELTTDDARDKVRQKSYHKAHTYKMAAGKTYRIDLMSKDFDTYLRLEDPTGKQVGEDDDGGEGLNSRLVYKAEQAGDFRVIATTFPANKTGKYTLVIVEANPTDLLLGRAKNIFKSSPAERKLILEDLTKHFTAKKDKLTMEDARLAMQVAQGLEFGAPTLAGDAYTGFGKVLVGAADAKVADIGKMFVGAGRRLSLPGKEMDIKGKTLDGKEVDLKSYRGKVVLVDFWATWCGPCRAELPNMKKMYEKYHEKGFDVLGISIDANHDALKDFLEKEKLPWKSVLDRAEGRNLGPLSQKYGIFSIPQAILVDREGRVISLSARGPELGRLLEKHIGAENKGGEKEK